MPTTTGRSAFLALLKDEGITHLFGNPGTTELPIMHALGEHPDLTYVLGMQESVVVYMADGFARASGKLVSCNVHVAPGLGNAMGAIYNAKFSGTPMIVTAGQQELGHGLTEPLLYDPLVPIAEPFTKWAVEVNRIEDLPRILRRAAKIATTPPTGPVFISLPGDILNDEADLNLMSSTRVETATRPSDELLDRLARRLLQAKSPVIVAGDEVATSNAFAEASRFAEVLGAPVYQQTVTSAAHYPSEHVCFIGAPGRDQKKVREILSEHDLLILLGSDQLRMSVLSTVEALPDGMPIVELGQRDWEMGKNYSSDLAVRADVRETLAVLNPALEQLGGDDLAKRAKRSLAEIETRNWTATRAKARTAMATRAANKPIDVDWLMMTAVDRLPENAVVVDEGITSTRSLLTHLPIRDPKGFFGLPSGGIGWGLPASVGMQLAQPDRRMLSIIGDGSAMYSIQGLWTAAHHKLPITFLIPNNGGYKILRQRLTAFHGSNKFIGMDFGKPGVDYTKLAESLGVQATRVTEPGDVAPALDASFGRDGPSLIEVMVEN
ncbi:MAG: thiamine pyrophosphate-binding protein [Rhodospirillaceae bacterium]|nr:thiamine pyrophosphate-binding protein [Rhodospirillaceae bacterium]